RIKENSKISEKEEFNSSERAAVPMPINAGVYLLEPDIFSYIEPKRKTSIERDVFPKLAAEKELFHYSIPGIWKDIGKPEELLEGNILLLNDLIKNLKEKKKNLIDNTVKFDGKVLVYPPVAIGRNVLIGNNCVIGPNAIIGDDVYIDKDTEIKESLIYNETYISKEVKIEKSIISDNCHIHDGAILKGNKQNLVILASYVEVLKNISLMAPNTSSISICHHEVVKENI
ncbi:unnamed protein product, partial [marine sediment metagenome]